MTNRSGQWGGPARDDWPSTEGPAAASGPPTRTPWSVGTVLRVFAVVFVAYLVISLVAGGILVLTKGDDFSDTEELMTGLLATIGFDLVIVAVAYWFGMRRFRLDLRAFGFRGFGWNEAGMAFGGLVVAWVLLTVYSTAVDVAGLDDLLPESTIPEDVFDEALTIVTGAVVTVLVAPLTEEMFFRGFVFAGLVPRLGFWWAAVASAALFSVAHLDPGSLVPFTLIGVVFAWLYFRTGSLWTAIGMHFTFNLISYSISVATEA